MDDDIRAQTIVVLTSGKGLEHALIIRRNKHGNKVGPMEETGNKPDTCLKHQLEDICLSCFQF